MHLPVHSALLNSGACAEKNSRDGSELRTGSRVKFEVRFLAFEAYYGAIDRST